MKRVPTAVALTFLVTCPLPLLAATQTAVAALQAGEPRGIPTWIWPVVAVLALLWIKALVPEGLFRKQTSGDKVEPADAPRTAPSPPAAPRSPAAAVTLPRHPPPAARAAPDAWTADFLQGLSLNRLETLVQRFWGLRGCEVARNRAADGSIELLIKRPGSPKLFALAQCAPNQADRTGAPAIKALAAAGAHRAAGIVVMYSLKGFTDEALALAVGQPIKLISAAGLLSEIQLLAPIQQQRLLEQTLITSGPALAR